MYVCHVYECNAQRGQKRASDFWELELWVVVSSWYGSWEPNLGPLQEKQVLLTSEISFLPLLSTLNRSLKLYRTLSCFPLENLLILSGWFHLLCDWCVYHSWLLSLQSRPSFCQVYHDLHNRFLLSKLPIWDNKEFETNLDNLVTWGSVQEVGTSPSKYLLSWHHLMNTKA